MSRPAPPGDYRRLLADIKVRVRAGAKREEVAMLSENRFAISIVQKAEQNLANRRVMEIIAAHFGVPLKKVRIINGHHSPSKMLSVD